MSHESDQSLYDNLSQAEIIAQMKALMKVLEKKEKASSKQLEKVEQKKTAAAPKKGVRPVQLDKNAAWVDYVHAHIMSKGWDEFTHAERMGKGMADVAYPKSVLTPVIGADGKPELDDDGEVVQAFVFEGSVSAAMPNGEQPSLSHAMTLSKLYRASKPELYAEFEAEYVPPADAAAPAPVAAAAPAPARVSMTLAEKAAEKARKEAEKAAEKAAKEAAKAAEKAAKEAAKAEAKRIKELEKAAKAAAKVPKGAAKAVIRAPVPVIAAKPVIATVTPRIKPVIAKPIVAKPVWVPPVKGDMKRHVINGIAYYVDHLNRVFPPDANDMPDDCTGVYIPATNTISDENIPEDQDE